MPGAGRLLVAAVACFAVSLILCEAIRRVAIRRALLDKVNDRSLHTVPTPRLGGVAIVVTALAAGLFEWTELRSLLVIGAVIAFVGLRDDLRPMSAKLRMALQIAGAAGLLWSFGVPPFLVARGIVLPFPPALTGALLAVWVVGVLNIYNFMDGMDGLAGSQTVTAATAHATLLAAAGSGSLSFFAVAIGAATAGFLAHNAPPARIFMGDAGSTFIGMMFAAFAMLGMDRGVPITETALPLAPFLLDGTFTILRRASRRERIWEAHRSHLYQRAVQTGLGHRDVLLVYLGWLAASLLAALLAPTGAVAVALGWTVAGLGLVGVWRWVVARESKRVDAA